MSTKHNVNHKAKYGRSLSHYPERLKKRGLSKAPGLEEIGGSTWLRARQIRRAEQTGFPWRVFADKPQVPDAEHAEAATPASQPKPAKRRPKRRYVKASL